jgi:UDP-glucuronate decarboxylase
LIKFDFCLKIYGDGEQTRSFQYVDDLVNGLVLLMNSNYSRPVNLGNPGEYKVVELATIVRDMIGNNNILERKSKVEDDPQRRKPDITIAQRELNWTPKTPLMEGLRHTVDYFRSELNKNRHINDDDSLHKQSDLYFSESEERRFDPKSYKVEL